MNNLPKLQNSQYIHNYSLKDKTFMKVGGQADLCLFPGTIEDLVLFLRQYEQKDKIYCCGNWSNVVVRDGGLELLLSLDNLCNEILFNKDEADSVTVGSSVLMMKFIQECVAKSISSCEQLYTIPGKIGGMIYMNAGIPGFEIKDVLLYITAIDKYTGEISTIKASELNMQYRRGNIPERLIILSGTFRTSHREQSAMMEHITKTREKRMKTQPITARTCGSTFKNPSNDTRSAWQLIREAGAHEIIIGGARMSEMHSNFLVNDGTATASDVISLISRVQDLVLKKTGLMLEPEIKIIGRDVS